MSAPRPISTAPASPERHHAAQGKTSPLNLEFNRGKRAVRRRNQSVTRCNALNGDSCSGGFSPGNTHPDSGRPDDYNKASDRYIRSNPLESLLIKRPDCDCQGGRRSQRPSRTPCQRAATLQLWRLRLSVSQPAFASSLLNHPCSDGQDFTAPHGPKAARKRVLLPAVARS